MNQLVKEHLEEKQLTVAIWQVADYGLQTYQVAPLLMR